MTATTRINYTNIYSQPSINIFSILNNRTYIPDPRDITGARTFVYNSDPLQKSFDFDGIPYIVCEEAQVEFPANKSCNMKVQTLSWFNTIIVRTAKDGSSGTRTDAGITDMRQIVDDIIQTFNSTTVKSTLHGYDMYNVECSVINIDSTLINQKLLHEVTLNVKYSTRIRVSV